MLRFCQPPSSYLFARVVIKKVNFACEITRRRENEQTGGKERCKHKARQRGKAAKMQIVDQTPFCYSESTCWELMLIDYIVRLASCRSHRRRCDDVTLNRMTVRRSIRFIKSLISRDYIFNVRINLQVAKCRCDILKENLRTEG